MLADLSIWHILILVVIIMLLFGSKRIPEIGRSIGKGIQEFKTGLREVTSHEEVQPPPQSEQRNVAPPPASSGAPKRLSQ